MKIAEYWVSEAILSERARCEHLGDEVESPICCINPRSMEFDDGFMAEGAEEVDLRVQALQCLR